MHDESTTTTSQTRIALSWALVGAPLAYGLVETLADAVKLFA